MLKESILNPVGTDEGKVQTPPIEFGSQVPLNGTPLLLPFLQLFSLHQELLLGPQATEDPVPPKANCVKLPNNKAENNSDFT